MKKLFMGAMVALTMVSCADNKYSVTAVFSNSDNDGKMVYLTNYDTGDTVSSAEVKNKCVRFEGEVEAEIFAGVGATGICAAGVYGSAGFGIECTLVSSDEDE